MTDCLNEIRRIIDGIYPMIRDLRRDLHKHPEIRYEEVRTAGKVVEHLRKLKVPHRTKVGKTGVVGVIRGKRKGKCVALRADMDALPMTEKNRFAHRSVNKGKMHACGHDGHTAGLVGVAYVLSRLKGKLKGSVKLIFQPAEEGGAGAAAMLRDGTFRDPKPDVIYALHTNPAIPLGKIGCRVGPMCASTTVVDIVFRGIGGHAARPHQSIDPIVMSAMFVQSVQTVVSRRVNPLDPAVLTFGTFQAGTVRNVIPDEALLSGTIRAYSTKVRDLVKREVKRIAEKVARSMGGSAEVTFGIGYPPVVNDEKATLFLKDVSEDALGRRNVVEAPATMGGEDFAYFQKKVPGTFFRLGNGSPKAPGHNPLFDFNDEALKTGMLVMSLVAIRWLEEC